MKAMGYGQEVITKIEHSGTTLSWTSFKSGLSTGTRNWDLATVKVNSAGYADSAGYATSAGSATNDGGNHNIESTYAKKSDLNNYMPYNASVSELQSTYGIGNLSVSSFSTNNCRIASGSTQTGNHVTPGDIYYYNVGVNIGNVLLILHTENKGSYDKYSGILFTFNGNTTFTNTPRKRYGYYINK